MIPRLQPSLYRASNPGRLDLGEPPHDIHALTMTAADLEHKGRSAPYSSASSARTIRSDDPTCTVKEESKKEGVQDVEKDAVAEKVEDAGPSADVGENPDGGLRAWLVVIGVSRFGLSGAVKRSILSRCASVLRGSVQRLAS